jgi:hypothetical protein
MDNRIPARYTGGVSLARGYFMPRACQVFIVASHPLFAQGVQSLLHGQPGLVVVGMGAAELGVVDQIRELRPDVVILDADSDAQTSLLPVLLRENLGVKLVGLTLEDNRIDVYYQHQIIGTDVGDLIEAVRAPLIWRGGLGGMRILAVIQGEYGRRKVRNIRDNGPQEWAVEIWPAPVSLPPTIEDPTDYLPSSLPRADLILCLTHQRGVVQLLPEIARMTGAEGVIVAVDDHAALPQGLLNQVHAWLNEIGVTAVFPKPLCSLTRKTYNVGPKISTYFDGPIAEFVHYFGKPMFRIQVDTEKGVVREVKVLRDALCGCARYVAESLVGVSVEEAEQKAGILHHHYPCLATMSMDPDYRDGLLNVSGNILRQEVRGQLEPFLRQRHAPDVGATTDEPTIMAIHHPAQNSDDDGP